MKNTSILPSSFSPTYGCYLVKVEPNAKAKFCRPLLKSSSGSPVRV
jgi:hypothetical protein